MSDIKSFYAVLPANVRYDKNICANAKLLYAEITALTNQKGYCWASNKHFADLYEVDIKSVKRWIKSLIDGGYLTACFGEIDEKGKTLRRCLRLVPALAKGDKIVPQEDEPVAVDEDDLDAKETSNLDEKPQESLTFFAEKPSDGAFFCSQVDNFVQSEVHLCPHEGDNFVHYNIKYNNITNNQSISHNAVENDDCDKKEFLKNCIEDKFKLLSADYQAEIGQSLFAIIDRLIAGQSFFINHIERSSCDILTAILDLFRRGEDSIIECYGRVQNAQPKNKFLYLITTFYNCSNYL